MDACTCTAKRNQGITVSKGILTQEQLGKILIDFINLVKHYTGETLNLSIVQESTFSVYSVIFGDPFVCGWSNNQKLYVTNQLSESLLATELNIRVMLLTSLHIHKKAEVLTIPKWSMFFNIMVDQDHRTRLSTLGTKSIDKLNKGEFIDFKLFEKYGLKFTPIIRSTNNLHIDIQEDISKQLDDLICFTKRLYMTDTVITEFRRSWNEPIEIKLNDDLSCHIGDLGRVVDIWAQDPCVIVDDLMYVESQTCELLEAVNPILSLYGKHDEQLKEKIVAYIQGEKKHLCDMLSCLLDTPVDSSDEIIKQGIKAKLCLDLRQLGLNFKNSDLFTVNEVLHAMRNTRPDIFKLVMSEDRSLWPKDPLERAIFIMRSYEYHSYVLARTVRPVKKQSITFRHLNRTAKNVGFGFKLALIGEVNKKAAIKLYELSPKLSVEVYAVALPVVIQLLAEYCPDERVSELLLEGADCAQIHAMSLLLEAKLQPKECSRIETKRLAQDELEELEHDIEMERINLVAPRVV